MAVFNSLGSNYKFGFVIRSLLSINPRHADRSLTDLLERHYEGRATLTYKGRHALELAVRQANLPPGSHIGINGFTCYVVYEAIVKSGHHPVFIDIAEGELNFGPEQLKAAHKKRALKAVIIQNTLGYPCDMRALRPFCAKEDIVIIEDLAHSLGAHYDDGTEGGLVGDYTMLSFSQDKPLDVVAGGAFIDRTGMTDTSKTLPRIRFTQRIVNFFYPFFSWMIRITYPLGIGRFLHAGLKKLHLLATPMSDNVKKPYRMSAHAKGLLLYRWLSREKEFTHRRTIADIYKQGLPAKSLVKAEHGIPTYLRFPLRVNDRKGLVAYLRQKNIFIGDTWYDAPVAPARYLERTSYQVGSCPNAEKLCEQIVNLPTHLNVTQSEAKRITEEVKRWLLK